MCKMFSSNYFTAFDTENGLTDEEMEQRHIAKHKMLGNIKFIGKLVSPTASQAQRLYTFFMLNSFEHEISTAHKN